MPRHRPAGTPSVTRKGNAGRVGARTDPRQTVGAAAAKPAGPKGRRTSEEARQEIIDAARAYISGKGLRDLTVDRLMQGTEIGRSAFYVYFASIHELATVFVHELSTRIETVIIAAWHNVEGDPIDRIRAMIRGGVEFWETNGPMIRGLEEASWHDDGMRAAFRDEIGLRPTVVTTEVILRDQARGLIGPMDAREMSVALNRFNLTYLNDRFGNPRRRSKPGDKEVAIEVLTRVWTATLYGTVTNQQRKRLSK